MEKIQNQRWIECKFFFLCRKILYPTKDFLKLTAFLSAMNWENTYDAQLLIDVATDLFIHKNNNPTLIECLIIEEEFPTALPKRRIQQLFKVNPSKIKRTIQTIRRSNIGIETVTPKYPPNARQNITYFIKTLQKLNKLEVII